MMHRYIEAHIKNKGIKASTSTSFVEDGKRIGVTNAESILYWCSRQKKKKNSSEVARMIGIANAHAIKAWVDKGEFL